MTYWIDTDSIDRQPDLMQGAPQVGFGEAFDASLEATMLNFRSNAESSAMSDEFSSNQERARTEGVDLPIDNPEAFTPSPLGVDGAIDPGTAQLWDNQAMMDRYDLAVSEARRRNPASGLLTIAEMRQRVTDRAREARVTNDELSQRTGFAGTAGGLAGGIVGSMTDPINIGSMVLTAPLALEGLAGFAANVAINMATEGATQGAQRDFLRRQGMTEQELDDQAITSVLMAGAGTAGLDLLLKGAGRVGRVALERLRRADVPQSVKDDAATAATAMDIEQSIPNPTHDPMQLMEHIERMNAIYRSVAEGRADPFLSRAGGSVDTPTVPGNDAALMRHALDTSPDLQDLRGQIAQALGEVDRRADQLLRDVGDQTTITTPEGGRIFDTPTEVVDDALRQARTMEAQNLRGPLTEATRLPPELIVPAIRLKDGSVHFNTEFQTGNEIASSLGIRRADIGEVGHIVDGTYYSQRRQATRAQRAVLARQAREPTRRVDAFVAPGAEPGKVDITMARPIGERIPDADRPPRPSVEEQMTRNEEIADGKHMDALIEELRSLARDAGDRVIDDGNGNTTTAKDVLASIFSDRKALREIEACIVGGE